MARGNYCHGKTECPICGKVVGSCGAITMHMRSHKRKGECKEWSDIFYGEIRRGFYYGEGFKKNLRVR